MFRTIVRSGAGALVALTVFAGAVAPVAPPAFASQDAETAAFLPLINAYRAQNGVGPLALDQKLIDAADWMSNDTYKKCNAKNDFGPNCSGLAVHTDTLGRTISVRIPAFGYPATNIFYGENITLGTAGVRDTAQQAMTAWKNSPDHNKAMLNGTYTAIGIARFCSPAGCAWVTDFGSKVVQAPANPPANPGNPPPANPGNPGTPNPGMPNPGTPGTSSRYSAEYAKWVQTSLNKVASAGLAVDGDYGPITTEAVKAFQRSKGITVDGIVGPQTEAMLVAAGAEPPPTSMRTNRNTATFVKWIQTSLNQVAGAGLAVDGINGPKTTAAIKAFQSSHGLVVDGIVGPITEAALIRAGAAAPPIR